MAEGMAVAVAVWRLLEDHGGSMGLDSLCCATSAELCVRYDAVQAVVERLVRSGRLRMAAGAVSWPE